MRISVQYFYISHTWVCDMRYICIPFLLILGVKVVYYTYVHAYINIIYICMYMSMYFV